MAASYCEVRAKACTASRPPQRQDGVALGLQLAQNLPVLGWLRDDNDASWFLAAARSRPHRRCQSLLSPLEPDALLGNGRLWGQRFTATRSGRDAVLPSSARCCGRDGQQAPWMADEDTRPPRISGNR